MESGRVKEILLHIESQKDETKNLDCGDSNVGVLKIPPQGMRSFFPLFLPRPKRKERKGN